MFTGLIREIAKVKSYNNNLLDIKANYKPNIGDSIAINGVCLTATKVLKDSFCVELSSESLDKIVGFKANQLVHIEPAMRLSDRLDGHIVQGHVDCIGEIIKIEKLQKGIDFYIKIPKEYMKFVIDKGSIAIDGVSLTINNVYSDSFRLTIIPHTFENTLFKTYKVFSKVNIETDMFARYLYSMFNKKPLSWEEVDRILYTY